MDLPSWAQRWAVLSGTEPGLSDLGLMFGAVPLYCFLTSAVLVFVARPCVYSRSSHNVLPDAPTYYVGRVVMNFCADAVIRLSVTIDSTPIYQRVVWRNVVYKTWFYRPLVAPVVSGVVDIRKPVLPPVTHVTARSVNFVSFVGVKFFFGSLDNVASGGSQVLWTPQPATVFPDVGAFEREHAASSVSDPLIAYYPYRRSRLVLGVENMFVPFAPYCASDIASIQSVLSGNMDFRQLFSDTYIDCGLQFSEYCASFGVRALRFDGMRSSSIAFNGDQLGSVWVPYAGPYLNIFSMMYRPYIGDQPYTFATLPSRPARPVAPRRPVVA